MGKPRDAARSPAAPTGTVTFAFTDIEGSTQRWDRDPVAMQDALRRHDRLMRAAIAEHGGHVFKTIGDAFCAAFQRVEDAAAGMLAAQRALIAEDFSAVDGLRVRAAIHTGTADERDADYFGPTVNRVARMLAIAHGGQLIASGATAELLAARGWDASRLLDLGEHRLKDLSNLEHVYQLLDPALARDFPPLRSLGILANNLPAQRTSFIGREREVAEITQLLEEHRLVTITGAGGIGKSRTSLQVGAALAGGSGHGVWFVELASVAHESEIALAVATAADLHVVLDANDERDFFERLGAKTRLLLLDNCEHLVDGVARFVEKALARTNVRILCTSRQRVAVEGESVYRMPSLSVPDPAASLTPESATAFEAIALFEARARSVDPRFALGERNLAVVAETCRRLDGIALAIELAAARLDVLTPAQLIERLNDRFRVLTRGDRRALPRQQTLRALIDWSYDLLDERERRALRRLSIFAGSFSLDAAERVVAGSGIEPDEVLDVISELVEKSLLSVDLERDDTARYRMIETIREYAIALFAADADRDDVTRRFAEWMIDAMETANRTWATEASTRWDERYESELANVRAGLEWSLRDRHAIDLGISLAGKAARFWGRIAPSEGRSWIALAHSLAETDGTATLRQRADLSFAETLAACALGQDTAALAAAEEAISGYLAVGAEAIEIAEARRFAGFALARCGRIDEAIALLESVLDIMRRSGSSQLLAYAAQDSALARCEAGRFAEARVLFDEAYRAFERAGNERGTVATTINLAEVAFILDDPADAMRIASGIRLSSRSGVSAALLAANVATYAMALERWTEAGAAIRTAIDLTAEPGNGMFPIAVQHAATIGLMRSSPDERERAADAIRLIGFADRGFDKFGKQRDSSEQALLWKALARSAAIFHPAEIERLRSEGCHWNFERGLYEVRAFLAPLSSSHEEHA